jgi:hypothetical protein
MLIRQLKARKAKMIAQHVSRGLRHTDTANSDILAEHSFPAGGLVALSRIAYQRAPLAILEIRPGVFVFSGAGGNVTALSASERCAVIDTGYGRRVEEIRRSIASVLQQAPRWLIDTHRHFDHTDGNASFAVDGTTIDGLSGSIRSKASRRNARPTSVSRAPCPGSG